MSTLKKIHVSFICPLSSTCRLFSELSSWHRLRIAKSTSRAPESGRCPVYGFKTTKCSTRSAHINFGTATHAPSLQKLRAHSCNNAHINLPAPGSDITAGTNFTVQIGLPNNLTGSKEIAIVIAIQSCPTGDCLPISEDMGTILYEGPFNPQYGTGAEDPYEDFSVQVPASFATGQAQLGLAHFNLIGELSWPYLQLENETVYVV